MKRLIALLLVIAMFPALLTVPAAAMESKVKEETVCASPTEALRECIQNIANMAEEPRTVAAVKELRDYADNVYYVCELEPTGYIIADASYGTILEYSPSAPSPYLGMNTDLIYLGPTYCYAKQNEHEMQDLFSGELVAADDEAFVRAAQETSQQLHAAQAACAAELSAQTRALVVTLPEGLVGMQVSPKAGAGTVTSNYILGGSILKTLTTGEQIGYYEAPGDKPNEREGVCGYIATGLLLYWVDELWSVDVINNFAFLRSNKQGFWGSGLTRELRSYGSTNDTAAEDFFFLDAGGIDDVIDAYGEAHSLSFDYNIDWAVLSGLGDVMKWLKNKQLPVILFGNLYNPQNPKDDDNRHAVLAYGWTEKDGESHEIIAHYGWENYSEVIVQKASTTFGSSLKFENATTNPVPITDVTKTNDYSWAYNAAQYCGRYQILPIIGEKLNPSREVTRGEFVQALYMLTGKPELKQKASITLRNYTDISILSPYYTAAAWTVENGIMSGTSDTTLGLSETLTRAQAAVFFRSYSNQLSLSYYSTSGPAAYSFSDYNDIPTWARDGMHFCTKRYLLAGVGNNSLSPNSSLTRAQIAVILFAISQKATRS